MGKNWTGQTIIAITKGSINVDKYIGTYRVFQEITDDGKASPNKNDSFLRCRYNIQIYRYNTDTLAMIFFSNQTANNILPQLKEQEVKLIKLNQGDMESTWLFSEKDIHKVAKVVKPQIKGKDLSPSCAATRRILQKDYKKNKK